MDAEVIQDQRPFQETLLRKKELSLPQAQILFQSVSKADIETVPQFSSSEPEVLFSGNFATPNPNFSGIFEIHPDGTRFLMLQNIGSETELSESELNLKVVVNWPELLK